MGEVLPLPNRGEVFLDTRGEGRSLRVSWHRHESTLVLSLWQLGQCRATFRLSTDEVPGLVHALVSGLSDSLAEHRDARDQLTRILIEPPDRSRRWGRPEPEPPTVEAPPEAAPTLPTVAAPPPAEQAPSTAPPVVFLSPDEPEPS